MTKIADKYLNMDVEEKRKGYKCGDNFVQLSDIPTWPEYLKTHTPKPPSDDQGETSRLRICLRFLFLLKVVLVCVLGKREVCEEINGKVSLWKGDITALEIEAIVNAANCSLLGGGGGESFLPVTLHLEPFLNAFKCSGRCDTPGRWFQAPRRMSHP